MPTVPNRYYNSPWIAQAAQNMSAALFGDPETELRRLQTQKLQADIAYEGEDRQRLAQGRAAFGKVPLGDETTTPQLLSDVFNLAPEYAGAAMDAAGVNDPEYLQKRQLLAAQHGYKLGDITAQGVVNTARDRFHASEQYRRAQLGSDTARYGVDTRFMGDEQDRQMRLQIAREQMANARTMRDAEAQLKIQLQDMKATQSLDVSPEDQVKAMQVLNYYAEAYGGEVTPDRIARIMGLWGSAYQTTRDSAAAMEQAVLQEFQGLPKVDKHWFGPDVLVPSGGGAPQAAPPSPAPRPAPTATAPAAAPPAKTRKPLSAFSKGKT